MLRVRLMAGTPVTLGTVTVTPQTRVVMWRTAHGGAVWNAPSAVLVEQDGRRRRIPIIDVTRVAQLVLLGMFIAVPVLQHWISGRGKEVNR